MKTFWIVLAIVVVLAIVYWFYQRNKTTEAVIVNEVKREPIPNRYAFRAQPRVVYTTNVVGIKSPGIR